MEEYEFNLKSDINICFLLGQIISDIDFGFIYNNKKHISIATFWLKPATNIVANKKIEETSIRVKAYDNYADIVYKNFNREDFIKIIGYIEKGNIIVRSIDFKEQINPL